MWYTVKMVRSLLAVAVVAEGTFQQTVQGHQNDLVKHLHVSCAFCHQAAPLFLKDKKNSHVFLLLIGRLTLLMTSLDNESEAKTYFANRQLFEC